MVDPNRQGLGVVGAEIEGEGARCLAIAGDVTIDADLQTAVEATVASFGDIHVLVNNAGIAVAKPLVETTDEDWDRVMAVNLRAPFMLTQLVARHMIERGIRGRIINVGSVLAERPTRERLAYIASKGALRTMTRAIAQELAEHGIAVNSVGPGMTPTGMNAHLLDTPEKVERYSAAIPWGELIQPSDVADACLFLASDDAEYMAGAAIYVDGGSLLD